MRIHQRKNAKFVARVLVRTFAIAATLVVAIPAGLSDAHAAAPITVTGAVALTTSSTSASFVTTQSALVTPTSNNQFAISQSSLVFTPIDVTLDNAVSFTVTLVASSDVTALIDPTSGSGLLSGQFTMLWQQDNVPGPPCSVGPFAVHASTAPFGSSPYSAQTLAVAMLDAAPAVPAAQGCAFAALVNGGVPLPVSAPSTPAPANTAPVPAWTLSLTFSAPLPTAPTTPTTDPTPTSPPPPSASTPPPPASSAPPPAASAPQHHTAAKPHVAAKATKTAKSAVTPVTATPPPIDPSIVSALPLDPATAGPASVNPLPGANNAIDPVPLGAKDSTSTTFVILGLTMIVIATAVALRLIGHDVRGLLPARSAQRLDGPIAARRLPAGANRSVDKKP